MTTVYIIRQAILAALKSYKGVPVDVDDLIRFAVSAALRAADPAAVRHEWDELRAHGYIRPIEGFGGAYCVLSDAGLRQLSVEFKQDPFIYGPVAN